MKQAWPTLYAVDSRDRIKFWEVYAEADDALAPARICIRYGYTLQEPEKHQSTVRKVAEGKNLGRSNGTTAYQQACSEAESLWQKKQDKKYTSDPSGRSNILLPMLAQRFDQRKHKIIYPAYTQPKFDGVRCLAQKVSDTEMRYISRGGKNYETLGHLDAFLLKHMETGEILDGEIYKHGWSQQAISSAVKGVKTVRVDPTQLEFWVYDLVVPAMIYGSRRQMLHTKLPFLELPLAFPMPPMEAQVQALINLDLPVKPVMSWCAMSEAQILEQHELYVKLGFEGTIIRNIGGLYKLDFRSNDLIKHKDFLDAEYRIVSAKEGTGKFEGKVTWICALPQGGTFEVCPKGTDEERSYWWTHREEFFGKWITVKYQKLSDKSVPIFPIGLGFREPGE